MNTLKPINLDDGITQIHPFRTNDNYRLDEIIDSLFEILSDKQNTAFIPEKRIKNKKEIKKGFLGIITKYSQELNYVHFITLKENQEVLGQINIISPKGIKLESKYNIDDNWFIEYFLNKKVWGYGIMSKAIKSIINNMKNQGIINISALCMPENIASIKILQKAGFKRVKKFDLKQDLYQIG